MAVAALATLHWSVRRLQLSRAKHPSLAGHARLSQLLARVVPFYEYGEDDFFAADDAPADVRDRRHLGFDELGRRLREKAPKTLALTEELEEGISDLQFIDRYRVPFQFRGLVRDRLRVGAVAMATKDRRIADLDGNWSLDAGGAYGLNVFGYEVYKRCIDKAAERALELGPVLGLYHPIVADNTNADFADFASRFVAATEVMAADGFFWADGKLTDRWIRRRVFLEMLEARLLGRRRPPRGQKAPADLVPALHAE